MIVQLIENSILFNNQAHIEINEQAFYAPVGNGTDCSLIRWLQKAEINCQAVMAQRSSLEAARVPFTSVRKTSLVAIRSGDDTVRVYMKGAPEHVLAGCNSHYNSAG